MGGGRKEVSNNSEIYRRDTVGKGDRRKEENGKNGGRYRCPTTNTGGEKRPWEKGAQEKLTKTLEREMCPPL